MQLYFTPGACSLAPHIVAVEAGAAVDLVKVDLGAKTVEGGGDYRAVNAKGYVPALRLDNGEVLTEVANLVQYLADRSPASQLAPAFGTPERYRLMEWLGFISAEIHKGFGPLFNPSSSDEAKTMAKDKLATRFGYLNDALEGRDFLMGDRFSAADAYAFTVLNWTGMLGVDMSPFPRVQAFMARVAARPKVQQAMRAEGLLKDAA